MTRTVLACLNSPTTRNLSFDNQSLMPRTRILAKPDVKLNGSAAALIPPSPTLPKLQQSARTCKACDLWKLGTQTVFGEGPARARVMFVGEQPGDSEDKAGHPFVGPAGRLLDEVLIEVGIDRSEGYGTNVVKHFKWEAAQRRKR